MATCIDEGLADKALPNQVLKRHIINQHLITLETILCCEARKGREHGLPTDQ